MRVAKITEDIVTTFFGTDAFDLHPLAFEGVVYPIDLDFTLKDEARHYEPKDKQGIPMKQYESVGRRYNPTRISSYCLAHFNRWVVKREVNSREEFIRVAEWFMASKDARWAYDFDLHDLNIHAPWISCIAQGEGISVLVRAYLITLEERYIMQARRAAEPFIRDINGGGVASMIDNNWPFLEEYPSATPIHVLNGFLYALIGLSDLRKVDPEEAERVGLSRYIATIEKCWKFWDNGYWSTYCLHTSPRGLRNVATTLYHKLHVSQIAFLANLYQSEQLQLCYERWNGYYRSFIRPARALLGKIRYRLEIPAFT